MGDVIVVAVIVVVGNNIVLLQCVFVSLDGISHQTTHSTNKNLVFYLSEEGKK